MEQKTLFDPAAYHVLRRRVEALQPGAVRQWGRMDAAQMLAHVNIPLEAGLGSLQLAPEGNFITRPLLKWYVLGKTSFRPGLPTAKSFVVADAREFAREKARLLDNLAEAHRRGLQGPWHPHNMFGALAPAQWGSLTHLHVDHHLRQFGG